MIEKLTVSEAIQKGVSSKWAERTRRLREAMEQDRAMQQRRKEAKHENN